MPLRKIRTLLVDDEHFNRKLLGTMLRMIDPDFVVVGEARGLEEARSLLKELSPDVIFLDIRMPDGSGYDLVKEVQGQQTSVILTSGYDDFKGKNLPEAVIGYVLKPVDQEKLRAMMMLVKEKVCS